MITRKLALNNLVWISIIEYNWPLDLIDILYESMKYNLEEASDYEWFINVDWVWKVNIKDIDYDFEFGCCYKKEQADYIRLELESRCCNFVENLAKYGLNVKWYSIWQPRYYNFEDDTFDVEFEFNEEEDWKFTHTDLIPYVKNYIDNVRQKSRDWYISFEPDSVEEVEMSDYAYLYAILDKEWMLDDVRQWIEEWIQTVNEYDYEFIDRERYEYEWKKYFLDKLEETLFPIQNAND